MRPGPSPTASASAGDQRSVRLDRAPVRVEGRAMADEVVSVPPTDGEAVEPNYNTMGLAGRHAAGIAHVPGRALGHTVTTGNVHRWPDQSAGGPPGTLDGLAAGPSWTRKFPTAESLSASRQSAWRDPFRLQGPRVRHHQRRPPTCQMAPAGQHAAAHTGTRQQPNGATNATRPGAAPASRAKAMPQRHVVGYSYFLRSRSRRSSATGRPRCPLRPARGCRSRIPDIRGRIRG